ncbi:hypothetical protein [Alpinimonas psychrophila]|uniref:Uncharacterized protein n=1 Tax=Alpinimonas psychrophila TaxID=748908 RepID=A0A7W3JSN7_9MICO|nr:hypothetical protein [Alpinimonas psychrophila]MBA8828397.1 hypothetical protein [Alpinimonas psychrophila]
MTSSIMFNTTGTTTNIFSRARQEVPTFLSAGAVVPAVDGTVFWIENIRGYSTGLTLLTQLIVSPEL